VANGWIHLLGTDMHRIDYRPPDVEGALRWLERHVEEELLEAMLCGNSLCIINNDRID
jgi:protein-tyrosine phosphatase